MNIATVEIPGLEYRQEFWLDGNKLFTTKYVAQGQITRGVLNNALSDSREKAKLFAEAAQGKGSKHITPGDIELRVIRAVPIACASFGCTLALSPEDAVWVDPVTRKATTGDTGAPYHVACAPKEI